MNWGMSSSVVGHEAKAAAAAAARNEEDDDDDDCCRLLLPNDLILEILSRVPARSLLRLRQVCKHWLNLISSNDSSFINMNLHHSMKYPCLLMKGSVKHTGVDYRYYFTFHSLNCWSKNYSDDHDALSVLPSFEESYFDICMLFIGHCNGLLCIKTNRTLICVWNPCTKEFKEFELPDDRPSRVPGDNSVSKNLSYAYGFGYDCTIDDYKLIAIESYSDDIEMSYSDSDDIEMSYSDDIPDFNCQLITQVCTLGAGRKNNNNKKKVMRWKRIERGKSPYVFRIASLLRRDSCGFFFNGGIYWMEEIDDIASVILCFDILKEEYKEILIPQLNIDDDYKWKRKFDEFKGSLCIFKYHMHKKDFVEAWILMKDDSSWTKLFTINGSPTGAVGRSLWYITIKTSICNDNGEMIVVESRCDGGLHMIWYNPSNLSRREFGGNFSEGEFGGFRLGHNMRNNYTESLVSLNSGIYIGQTYIGEEDDDDDDDDDDDEDDDEEDSC